VDAVSLTSIANARDNVGVIIPRAFAQQDQFAAAVAEVERQLHPNVVYIRHSLGNDWTGEPAVFFKVLLSDAASNRDQLLSVANQIEDALVWQIEPLEQWGVLPYFNYRSQSEQADMKEAAWA
jgi:hypothetical protein